MSWETYFWSAYTVLVAILLVMWIRKSRRQRAGRAALVDPNWQPRTPYDEDDDERAATTPEE